MEEPMKFSRTISTALAVMSMVAATMFVFGASPATAAPANSPIRQTACDSSNSFNYFTFYTGGLPVCYEGEGTLFMHFGPVGLWYAENNQGSFTYILPDSCPPPVIFNPHESGTLPPGATITALNILYGS
jgi:hypothetical protein